ncbi:hypothetical protein MBLNU230_g7546t1 [Neophaeotheca triangularis]
MSDPASEPGAPDGGNINIPPAAEGSVSKKAQAKLPNLASIASTPDRVLLRLNKLLAAPGGLSAFLSTFNYTLYLLAYLEAKSLPLQARLAAILSRTPAASAISTLQGPSQIAAFAGLLSNTRTTLRLFGLFPLYAWFRQLLQGPKPGQDTVLYCTSLAQCTLYMIFQGLENIALLTDHKVLSPSLVGRIDRASPAGSTAGVYKISYRAWMLGVMCDFIRLGREAQLEQARRAERDAGGQKSGRANYMEQDAVVDKRWWQDAVVPLSWAPMALQFGTETGFPGFNLGMMGLSGGIAGLGKIMAMWEATK